MRRWMCRGLGQVTRDRGHGLTPNLTPKRMETGGCSGMPAHWHANETGLDSSVGVQPVCPADNS